MYVKRPQGSTCDIFLQYSLKYKMQITFPKNNMFSKLLFLVL